MTNKDYKTILFSTLCFSIAMYISINVFAGLQNLSDMYNRKNPKPKILKGSNSSSVTKTTEKIIERPVYKTVDRVVEKPVYKTVEKPIIVEKQILVPQYKIDVYLNKGDSVVIGSPEEINKHKINSYMNWKEEPYFVELERLRMDSELKIRDKILNNIN